VLNYFGQGALVLAHPEAVDNPFYRVFPDWALYPMVVLATAATVIASQAVISGAFSLSQQAMQLGLLPRLDVHQTSEEAIGQVYVPQINWLLMVCVIGLVLSFRSSDNLAAAYGIAVAGTMVITTGLLAVVARRLWHWSLPVTAAGDRHFPDSRSGLLRRERRQDSARWLVSAADRRGRVHAHVHLASRPADRAGAHQ
jgi:KUP system potassium uptake protein